MSSAHEVDWMPGGVYVRQSSLEDQIRTTKEYKGKIAHLHAATPTFMSHGRDNDESFLRFLSSETLTSWHDYFTSSLDDVEHMKNSEAQQSLMCHQFQKAAPSVEAAFQRRQKMGAQPRSTTYQVTCSISQRYRCSLVTNTTLQGDVL
ncbi:hypothetical protein F4776DRAFT_80710 [Hypoxylon sp. NC0597]|nr:hypothetical protein F4776DRAFT_80710 [Hypoxylon sp. NC0597]